MTALTFRGARALALISAAVAACGDEGLAPSLDALLIQIPSDFPPLPVPTDNPLTREKVALGKKLFFEKRLSRTGEVSCGSCHLPERAFSDPRRVSLGVEERAGKRNAPALVNLAWSTSFFWDGGVDTLERQALAPIIDMNEMDLPIEAAAQRLAEDDEYRALFMNAFATAPTPLALTEAIASFVRTLVSGQSPYDRYRRGELTALGPLERQGMALFFGEKGECFHCHDGFNLTNDRFAHNGTYVEGGDEGRRRVTLRDFDLGRFKVPTLRNVAVTAPYMHDGSLPDLESVIDHYARGGRGHQGTDPLVRPLELTAIEKLALVAFLSALTDERFLSDARFRP